MVLGLGEAIGSGQSRGALRSGGVGSTGRAQIPGLLAIALRLLRQAPRSGGLAPARRAQIVLQTAVPMLHTCRLDHCFEHVTLMQIEWGAPSPARRGVVAPWGRPFRPPSRVWPARPNPLRSWDFLRSASASFEEPHDLEESALPNALR